MIAWLPRPSLAWGFSFVLLASACTEPFGPELPPGGEEIPEIETSAGAVFAVGTGGLIVHFDGQTWSATESSHPYYYPGYVDVWASSAADAYAVGNWSMSARDPVIHHYNGSGWQPVDGDAGRLPLAVHGTSANNVFVVGGTSRHWSSATFGDQGLGAHFDGASWAPIPFWTSEYLTGVSGRSPDDYYVTWARPGISPRSGILHHDGASWTNTVFGVDTVVHGIWAAAGTHAYAVGDAGLILRNRGAGWEGMTSGTRANLTAVWGVSSGDVFAAGESGAVFHYDGLEWTAMATPTDVRLNAVWGTSSTDVFAVGEAGTILHYDGTDWVAMSSGTSESLRDVSGSSPNDVFVVGGGGTVLHHTGTSWSHTMSGERELVLTGVWAASASDVTAVDLFGTILHYDGTRWTTVREADGASQLTAIRGVGNELRVVGGPGMILKKNGTVWTILKRAPTARFRDIWATGDQAFALGDAVWHFDGSAWDRLQAPGLDRVELLTALWGASPTDLFAVGAEGLILHYDGVQWTPMASGTEAALEAIWGSDAANVFVVGSSGTILHYDGSSWTSMDSGTAQTLVGISGVSGTDVFTVGANSILHYDGTAWQSLPTLTERSILAVVAVP